MDTMENGFKCGKRWAVKAALGEVEQAKQSLFWAEESAEKRKVKRDEDLNVQVGDSRVERAAIRLRNAERDLSAHDCSRDPICAILQKDENGS